MRFTGDDRFMGDYLRSELLERVSSEQVAFLTRIGDPRAHVRPTL